jgi:ankyrin repeat protein
MPRTLPAPNQSDTYQTASTADQAENGGLTPLTWAAYRGHESTVRLLLEHSADVNQSKKNGETPLFNAAYRGRIPVIDILLDSGADSATSGCTG